MNLKFGDNVKIKENSFYTGAKGIVLREVQGINVTYIVRLKIENITYDVEFHKHQLEKFRIKIIKGPRK